MSLLFRLLADAVVLLHAAYVLFVVLALPLILVGAWRGWGWVHNRTFRGLHLAMILVVVLESWLGITCPLTTWEQWLREWSGGRTYRGDFIATLVHDWLFFDAEPWVFTLIYTLFGGLVVLSLLLVPPRGRRQCSASDSGMAESTPGRSDSLADRQAAHAEPPS